MRRVRIDEDTNFRPEAVLARDVFGADGEVLARAGFGLNARTARSLSVRGVAWCDIDDAVCEGVTLQPAIENDLEHPIREFATKVYDAFHSLCEEHLNQPTTRLLEILARTTPTSGLAATGILDDLRLTSVNFGLHSSDVTGDSGYLGVRLVRGDLVGHVVSVAALSARIAGLVGFSANELADVTRAALLHDVGMLFVPESVLEKRATDRSSAEQLRYEDHTQIGEAMLTPVADRQLHMPIIASEHHEHPDGSGYPRGATGTNRLLRDADEQRTDEQTTLASDVVAVADAYERLTSPEPGRAPLEPFRAVAVLRDMAGSQLNAEITKRFTDSIPPVPVGTTLILRGGEFEGMRALVIRLNEGALTRPWIRVYASAHGAPVDLADYDLQVETAIGYGMPQV